MAMVASGWFAIQPGLARRAVQALSGLAPARGPADPETAMSCTIARWAWRSGN